MFKFQNYKYGLLSGILFGFSWNSYFPVISLFFAFTPLFYVQKHLKLGFIEFFNISLLAFMIFHLATVWWIYKSSFIGFFAVITLNSLFMASTMGFFHIIYTKLNKYLAYLSFIVFWLSFEHFHYHWQISWPFMNLGNWFGQTYKWIQWYEYTGVAGGTLWILLVNLLFFESADFFFQNKKKPASILLLFSIITLIIPIYISNQLISEPAKNNNSISVLLVQPNINPYTEKYNSSLFNQQIKEQIKMVQKNITPQTDVVLYPEASFPLFLNKDSLLCNKDLKELKKLSNSYKNLSIIVGLFTFNLIKNDTLYYNTAVHINYTEEYSLYYKSKLVPAIEKTPFADYFMFLKNWNVDFGGIKSSLGVNKQRTVFATKRANIAPVICYESVYGEFVSEFVKNGADIIAVMTNDAWWGNTPAYNQILMHSKLRAIETRRTVIRSANTGISCLIDKNGSIKDSLQKNKKAVLSSLADKNNILTFYVKNGDFIGKFSVYISIILLFLFGFIIIKNKQHL